MTFSKKYLKYVISFSVAFLFTVLVIQYELSILPKGRQSLFRAVSDGFFFSGVLFLSFSLLAFIANTGLFNSMNYALKRIGNRLRHPKEFKTNFISYYEYVQTKKYNSRRFVFLCITGIVFLLLSFIFLFCFYFYY